MTLESHRDLPENGTLQKNTFLRNGIYFPVPQDDSRISSRFARKRYASKKYPYKAEFIFWCFNLGDGVPKVDFLCPFFLKFAAQLGSGIRPEPRRWLEYFDTSEFVK